MYRLRRSFVVASLLLLPAFSHVGWAQTPSASEDPDRVEVGADGFRLVSGDGAFALRLRGDLYADARFFPGTTVADGAERFFIRRSRMRLQGTLYERFSFTLRPDFGIGGPEIDDAFLEMRFVPALRLRMGRFKEPVGLENLQSTTGLMHMERGYPTALVPGRDVGIMLSGDVASDRLTYALGVFNGTPGSTEPGADADNDKEVAARVFATPFSGSESLLEGLGVGLAGTTGGSTAGPAGLPDFETTGSQSFFQYRPAAGADGSRHRLAPQARLFLGPVELLGEYTILQQEVRFGLEEETLTHRAWQASGAVVLTGEDAREGEVEPRRPLGRDLGPGALELAARFHALTLDDDTFPLFAAPATTASDAQAWSLTLSWHPNTAVRVMAGFERTTFDTAAPTSSLEAENVIITRMQVAF